MTTHRLLSQNFNWEVDTPSLLNSLRGLFHATADSGSDITHASTAIALSDSVGKWADVSDVVFQCADPEADDGDVLEVDRRDYMIFDVERLSGNWISASMISLDTLEADPEEDDTHEREYPGVEYELN